MCTWWKRFHASHFCNTLENVGFHSTSAFIYYTFQLAHFSFYIYVRQNNGWNGTIRQHFCSCWPSPTDRQIMIWKPLRFCSIWMFLLSLSVLASRLSDRQVFVWATVTPLSLCEGLDPVEPYFQDTDASVRLDTSDAAFVDVIHTDALPFDSKLGTYHCRSQRIRSFW